MYWYPDCVISSHAAYTSTRTSPSPHKNPIIKTDFKEKTIDFLARDLRPAGKGFESLIQAAIDVGATYGRVKAAELLSDPTTLSRGLSDRTQLAKDEVCPKLAARIRSGSCAGTMDMWTDEYTQNHFLTVTLHFIEDEVDKPRWEYKSLTLFTSRFPFESASGDNIKEEIIAQFVRLKFHPNDYLKIKWTTDGGLSIINALVGCGRTGCMAHALNNVLKHVFSIDLKDADLYGTDGGKLVETAGSVTKYLIENKLDKEFPGPLAKFPKRCSTQYRSKVPALESLYKNYDQVKLCIYRIIIICFVLGSRCE